MFNNVVNYPLHLTYVCTRPYSVGKDKIVMKNSVISCNCQQSLGQKQLSVCQAHVICLGMHYYYSKCTRTPVALTDVHHMMTPLLNCSCSDGMVYWYSVSHSLSKQSLFICRRIGNVRLAKKMSILSAYSTEMTDLLTEQTLRAAMSNVYNKKWFCNVC